MTTFVDLGVYQSMVILILLLILVLLNGHIMAYGTLRAGKIRFGAFSLINISLYYGLLVLLTSYIYEKYLGSEHSFWTEYFARMNINFIVAFIIGEILFSIFLLARARVYKKRTITKAAIKESADNLPMGVCSALEGGLVALSNWEMNRICHLITGKDLQNADRFWDTIISGNFKNGAKRWGTDSNPIISFPDGRTWSFQRRSLKIEGEEVSEITAIDTSELNELRLELERNNKALIEMGVRLRKYSSDVLETKAKEEKLAIKMMIHDDLGYVILATRHFFRWKSSDEEGRLEIKVLLKLWRKSILILRGGEGAKKTTVLDSLISAGQSIGIKVVLSGQLTKDIEVSKLILESAGECLTNSVRHAYATEMYLDIKETGENYIVNISNNGVIPKTELVEGGGLSSIRNKIESRNGVMELSHKPVFNLRLTIPRKGDGCFEKSSNC